MPTSLQRVEQLERQNRRAFHALLMGTAWIAGGWLVIAINFAFGYWLVVLLHNPIGMLNLGITAFLIMKFGPRTTTLYRDWRMYRLVCNCTSNLRRKAK